MTATGTASVAKQVVSDDQVRLTLIDDSKPAKPTWSHWFVPKHLTVEQGQLTVARSRGGRLWPSDLTDTSPANLEGMAAVLTWRDRTFSGRIASVKQSVAVIRRDRA
ncbi:hypothetical protein BV210_11295 [Halorientalis sp. IM1011]|uniref:hypothetical protein n=1 Tax=Halorientalis sp. IM1011 TaxID=1932360 RepID=UPI00097CC942|nr:hypothetical protein [Halorientalis sp. IM1011]AQL43268.1 hypothetical protein BV210_11295 [Halorientalis sp. IM1011]